MGYATESSRVDGWIGIDEVQRSFASWRPTLSEVARHLLTEPRSDRLALPYKAFREVLGAYPTYPRQAIGDCVGHAHARGLDMLRCVGIALGENVRFRESSPEFIYGISREVAGILEDREGSYGSAAVAAMATIGVASRSTPGCEGLYDGERSERWGREGVPAEIKARSRGMRLGAAARVTTWAELVAAMTNGYPVTVCSTQGFDSARDVDGFCTPKSGLWGHCLLIGGVRNDRPGACLLQSWGPDEPIGPTTLDQPCHSFWSDRSVIEHMLAQGDSWALSESPQFVARTLPEHWSHHQTA